MSIASTILVASSSLVFIYVIGVLARNFKAQQFFKSKAPNLPVPPNKNILSGHLYDVIMTKKNWLIIDKLHGQYGPTFGLYCANQPWVTTKDLDLIKLIQLDNSSRHINRVRFLDLIKEFSDSFAFADDDDWRRQRRIIAPIFTNHKVRSEEVTSEFDATLKLLKAGLDPRMTVENGRRSAIVNADDMLTRYSLEVILSVFYGRNGEIDFRSSQDYLTSVFDESRKAFQNPLLYMSVIFPIMVPLLRFLFEFHKVGRLKQQVCKYIVELADIKQAASTKRDKAGRQASMNKGDCLESSSELDAADNYKRRMADPFIDALIDKRINRNEFVIGLYILLFAGFQTTADTMACLVWHLATRPHIQEQLRSSIMETGIESDYLAWCIKETLRIHPAVPLGLGRVLGEDITINGLSLPKGTFVMPSVYSIHHDANIWPEPDEFKPERWRDTSGQHAAAFMAFGLGPRNCIGGKFAMQEIKQLMQMLLTNYRIEKCPETPDKYAFSSPLLTITFTDQPTMVRLVALNEDSSV